MRWMWVVVLGLASVTWAQDESYLHADFRREMERMSDACKDFSFKVLPGCAIELFTDHPLHIAAGSLPAQNGFGLGGAYAVSWDTKSQAWRLSWDVDVVGTTNASWRAGGYMKLIHLGTIHAPKPVIPKPGETPKLVKRELKTFVHPFAVFNLYAQAISLNKLNYFGLGDETMLAGASVFGMTQTVVGGSVIKPVYELPAIRKLNLALLGEVNGRFVDIRGENGQSVPSIESVYTNATAPGLVSQPGFVQLGEGFRIEPVIADRLELNYTGKFEQFFAPSSSTNSFLRWTVDLNHTFYLYGHAKSPPAAPDTSGNGPDTCAHGDQGCPKVSTSWNRNGFVTARVLLSESINSATSAVPFYFQQTLGGSDINGDLSLGSYQDYRFRAPNLLLFQGGVEHSIWGPFGAKFMADGGQVALTRGAVGFNHMKHSFAVGLSLRAGAFPMVSLMFAWGGPEGTHNILNMNSSLLNGSARPLLD
jgi:hypothetical protein